MDVARRSSPFRRILVPLDGSVSGLWILDRLENLFKRPGAQVTLLRVEELKPWKRARGRVRSQAIPETPEEFLAGVRKRLAFRGIQADTKVRTGDPAREIILESLDGGHDVIAISTAGASRIRRVVNRSVAHDVMRLSSLPVILCRRLSRLNESFFSVERSEPAAFRRVLVPLDQSRTSEEVLPHATELARAFRSELLLVTVLGSSSRAYDRQAALAYLERWARVIRESGVACTVEVRAGDPSDALTSLLESKTDCMAITTRGRSSLASAVLGSVTLNVLNRVEGPILVVRSVNGVTAEPGPGRQPALVRKSRSEP